MHLFLWTFLSNAGARKAAFAWQRGAKQAEAEWWWWQRGQEARAPSSTEGQQSHSQAAQASCQVSYCKKSEDVSFAEEGKGGWADASGLNQVLWYCFILLPQTW